MAPKIKNWSTTEASNNAVAPNGAPEGMAPSKVNDVLRMVMAAVRGWWEDAQWIDFGYAGLTYFDATNFTVTGDKTTIFTVGRRVRAIGTTPFTVYGRISVSAYNAPNTKVTVVWDAGTLDNTLSEIAVGPTNANKPVAISGVDIPDASIAYASISGTPTIPSAIPTGVVFPYTGSAAPATYLLVSGKTIGNAASNATARANADTSDLFTLLWNTFANTELPILTSAGAASIRGANAAADFAANKALPLLDLRGRVVAGLDNMGGTVAGRLTAASLLGTTVGKTGGEETHVLTTAELAAHTHHTGTATATYEKGPPGDTVVLRLDDGTGGSTGSAGGGGAHNNVQPTIVLPFIIKL